MKKFLLIIVFFLPVIVITAQTVSSNENSSTNENNAWRCSGTFSLALAQGGSRNWAPGGDRFSLALNSFLTVYANHTKNRRHWDNMIEANFGLVNTTLAGIIKNDDKLDLSSRLSYELGNNEIKHWQVGGLMNFRTQFSDGYDYDSSARKRISSFLAPGIFILSPGIEYFSTTKNLSIHLSPFSGRWILVPNRPYELAANYGVQPNRQVKIEGGAFLSVNFNKEIIKNVQYRSRLDVFSDFLGKTPANLDVFWTNVLQMRINKYLGVVYNFDLQYDDDTKIFGYSKNKPGTQLKSILGVGLSVAF